MNAKIGRNDNRVSVYLAVLLLMATGAEPAQAKLVGVQDNAAAGHDRVVNVTNFGR